VILAALIITLVALFIFFGTLHIDMSSGENESQQHKDY
jgi:hypothetical protein